MTLLLNLNAGSHMFTMPPGEMVVTSRRLLDCSEVLAAVASMRRIEVLP
jgi:hypothetical protein